MGRTLVVAAMALMGCDAAVERLDPPGLPPLPEDDAADARAESSCDPFDGWGCGPAEKCALMPARDGTARAACVAEGWAGIGQRCGIDEASGADTCMRGLTCADGTCKEVCRLAPDSCPADRFCARPGGALERAGLGVCQPACDLFAHDCDAGESCFLATTDSGFVAICAPAYPEPPPSDGGCGSPGAAEPGRAGDCCSYVNTCGEGFACIQPSGGRAARHGTCAYLCDPTGSVQAAPHGCDPPGPGPAPAFACRPLGEVIPNAGEIPATLGVCL